MASILDAAFSWMDHGHSAAIATVMETWGSSPRPVGSRMAIRDDGFAAGSVSGGCVESAVIEEARSVLSGGASKILEYKGIDPQAVWEVGLTCGGRIRVLLEDAAQVPRAVFRQSGQWLTDRISHVWVHQVSEKGVRHSLVSAEECLPQDLSSGVQREALQALGEGSSRVIQFEGSEMFLNVLRRKDRLIIVGAVHIAIPLTAFAKELGFEVIVVDPREALLQEERFETPPDRVLASWPQEALQDLSLDSDTYAAVLSHDSKIDDPAVGLLLRSPVRYVGALGSKSTQARRRDALFADGLTESDLERIHGPIGLDIGARSPEEIALSIIAEIVKVRRKGA